MITVLFADQAENWTRYEAPLHVAFAEIGMEVNLIYETDEPEAVDYVVYAPSGPVSDFGPYVNLKAVLSLWAGVEKIEGNASIQVPLCRMVDEGLSEGMVEWVTGHILRHHLGMDAHIFGQDGEWRNDTVPPLARDRSVGFLGLGALGLDCAKAAMGLGFNVLGWSRSLKTVEGVSTFAGVDGLREMLGKCQIVVLLLPDTADTQNVLNPETLDLLPDGAFIINPGRGPLIDDAALLNALDTGKIAHATLDVFRVEPLPAEHPFWAHPKVTVTPHIASDTRPSSASRTIAENIRRGEAGEPFLYTVDRTAGY
ncbi:glyoxylate/hydroxypyruvate reductase A [Rhodobacterales bacterium 52_120_T64]|nr:glyoxylate/hydroxypyruvate reductase A [Rhodobacterales bacterium 52_120_T64]